MKEKIRSLGAPRTDEASYSSAMIHVCIHSTLCSGQSRDLDSFELAFGINQRANRLLAKSRNIMNLLFQQLVTM